MLKESGAQDAPRGPRALTGLFLVLGSYPGAVRDVIKMIGWCIGYRTDAQRHRRRGCHNGQTMIQYFWGYSSLSLYSVEGISSGWLGRKLWFWRIGSGKSKNRVVVVDPQRQSIRSPRDRTFGLRVEQAPGTNPPVWLDSFCDRD